MKGRRTRGLTAEEKALWNRVAERTVPLHPKRKTAPPEDRFATKTPKPPAPRPPERAAERAPIAPFRVGERAGDTAPPHDIQPGIGARLQAAPLNMDRKSFTRMKRGKLKPEARIDLHGMTLDRAHPALTRFILDAQARELRLVLVITGKGRGEDGPGPMPPRRGILKRQVPAWLQQPPLSQAVLQVSEAHLRHGGTGAYYVYLRRRR
jgi:DNA-nicking Smr family endonuclease